MQNKLLKNDLYEPSEDTFFLSKYLENETGDDALDIGTGSGYLARILLSKFANVVATDINFYALKSQNPKLPNCICCENADALRFQFDLIVCNMPYLPSKEISDQTVDGGKEGIEVPLKIIQSVKNCLKENGSFLFLTSSLANFEKLMEETKKLGFSVNTIASKKLFFEELILVKAKKNNSS